MLLLKLIALPDLLAATQIVTASNNGMEAVPLEMSFACLARFFLTGPSSTRTLVAPIIRLVLLQMDKEDEMIMFYQAK